MATKRDKTQNETLVKIAREALGIETLDERGRDQLDFHDLSVASVRKALEQAYEAGRHASPRSADRQ